MYTAAHKSPLGGLDVLHAENCHSMISSTHCFAQQKGSSDNLNTSEKHRLSGFQKNDIVQKQLSHSLQTPSHAAYLLSLSRKNPRSNSIPTVTGIRTPEPPPITCKSNALTTLPRSRIKQIQFRTMYVHTGADGMTFTRPHTDFPRTLPPDISLYIPSCVPIYVTKISFRKPTSRCQ